MQSITVLAIIFITVTEANNLKNFLSKKIGLMCSWTMIDKITG